MSAKLTNAQILMLERCITYRGLYSFESNRGTFRALVRRGLIERVSGFKTLYTITDAGRQALEGNDGN